MLLDFWLTAHGSAVSDIFATFKPQRAIDRLRLAGWLAALISLPGVMAYERLPGLRHVVIGEVLLATGALVLWYGLEMIRYPASRVASYRLEIASLRRDLEGRSIAESCIVALSEFLCEMLRLQNQEVRSQAQYQAWQQAYQATVQSTYILISRGISNSAALTFVSYPVSEIRFWRGAYNEDHARTKSILDKYMVKLNTIIEGHYLAMQRGPTTLHAIQDASALSIAS